MSRFRESIICNTPTSEAVVKGSDKYPNIHGKVRFYRACCGTVVKAEISGLPGNGFFAFHIHEGGKCAGNESDPFADAKGHFNPEKTEHPFHAGDMPPLLSSEGYAWSAFFTDKFTPEQIKGKTVIIHRLADDFHTQPSGGAGEKIACGMVR